MRLNQQILRLAVPNILSNLSVPLLGLVDTVLMGHQESITYIGAIGLADVIFNVLYWGFAFLRMGVTGLTAQAYGRNDGQDSILTLGRGVTLGLMGGLLFILFQGGILEGALLLMDNTEFAEGLIREYYGIRIYTAPATLALLAFHGWFLGRQNAFFPMLLTIGVNVVNIIASLFFLKVMDLGIGGLAWGTLLAQYTGVAGALILFAVKYRAQLTHWSWAAFGQIKALGRFFEVNFALFLRGLILVGTLFFFLSESSHFGEMALSVNNLYRMFLMIMAFGLDGFAYAAESLTGKYIGEGDRDKVKKAAKYLFAWSLGLGVMISTLYILGGDQLLGLMTDKPEVVEAARPYLWWVVGYTLLSAIAFMWDGIYFGATASWYLLINAFLGGACFFAAYFLFRDQWGNHALWLAMVVFVAIRAVGLSLTSGWAIFRFQKK